MFSKRLLAAPAIALVAGLSACADSGPVTEPGALMIEDADFAKGGDAAYTERVHFTTPFPPPASGLSSVPLPAPCLGLEEVPRMAGQWTGWYQLVGTPGGRVHVTERIDYADIVITAGDLTWRAGPGASETIIENAAPITDEGGQSAYIIVHQFQARFLSQDGLPDLRVSHSYHMVLGPDLEFRRDDFRPFSAECIGG